MIARESENETHNLTHIMTVTLHIQTELNTCEEGKRSKETTDKQHMRAIPNASNDKPEDRDHRFLHDESIMLKLLTLHRIAA